MGHPTRARMTIPFLNRSGVDTAAQPYSFLLPNFAIAHAKVQIATRYTAIHSKRERTRMHRAISVNICAL